MSELKIIDFIFIFYFLILDLEIEVNITVIQKNIEGSKTIMLYNMFTTCVIIIRS